MLPPDNRWGKAKLLVSAYNNSTHSITSWGEIAFHGKKSPSNLLLYVQTSFQAMCTISPGVPASLCMCFISMEHKLVTKPYK